MTCRARVRRSRFAIGQALDDGDLLEALAREVKSLRVAGASVTFSVSGTPRPLPAAATLALLRTAREAARNALCRSDAGAVCVELSYAADGARLNVIDDGRGFRPADVAPGGPLRGLLDRALEVGADAAVLTPPGGGTQVSLIVPFEGDVGPGCAPAASQFPFFDAGPGGPDDVVTGEGDERYAMNSAHPGQGAAPVSWPAPSAECYLG